MTWLIHTCRESCHASNAPFDVRDNQRGSIQQRLLSRTHVSSNSLLQRFSSGQWVPRKRRTCAGDRESARERENRGRRKKEIEREKEASVWQTERARESEKTRVWGEKNREREKDGSFVKVSFVVFSAFSEVRFTAIFVFSEVRFTLIFWGVSFRFLRSQLYSDFRFLTSHFYTKISSEFSFTLTHSQTSLPQWFPLGQQIADRVAQDLKRLFPKLFQRTRILLMGFTISITSDMILIINLVKILVCLVLKWKILEITSRFCATLSAIGERWGAGVEYH